MGLKRARNREEQSMSHEEAARGTLGDALEKGERTEKTRRE